MFQRSPARDPGRGRSSSASRGKREVSPRRPPADRPSMLVALADAIGLSKKFGGGSGRGRNRAPSDCTTQADSDASTEDSPRPSPPELAWSPRLPLALTSELLPAYPDSDDVILFDWDDTLMPTSYLFGLSFASEPGRCMVTRVRLGAVADLVEAALRAARSQARVSIVTLAQRGWFEHSAAENFGGLDFAGLLEELGISVYFAQEERDASSMAQAAFAAGDWISLKHLAMSRCLEDWRAAGALRGDRPSVLSVGDSECERLALRRLLGATPDSATSCAGDTPLCKTVKLMDKPGVKELSDELRQLPSLLRGIAACDADVDLAVSNPAELEGRVLVLAPRTPDRGLASR